LDAVLPLKYAPSFRRGKRSEYGPAVVARKLAFIWAWISPICFEICCGQKATVVSARLQDHFLQFACMDVHARLTLGSCGHVENNETLIYCSTLI